MFRYTFKFTSSKSFIGKIDSMEGYGDFRVNVTCPEIIVSGETFDEALVRAYEFVKGLIKPLKSEESCQLCNLEIVRTEQM